MTDILLVEDNLDLLEKISGLLEAEFEVITAVNGKDALEKLAEYDDISAIVTDYSMPPGINGYKLAEKIRENERYNSIPIIGMSTDDPTAQFEQITDAFVYKELVIDNLINEIKKLTSN